MDQPNNIINQLRGLIKTNNIERFGMLLNRDQTINLNTHFGNQDDTLLHVAARCAKIEFVRLLVKHGADINSLNRHSNNALLSVTLFANRNICTNFTTLFDTIRFLLESGSDPNIHGLSNFTALINVCRNTYPARHIENIKLVIELLIDYGADRNLTNSSGRIAEQEAIRSNNGILAEHVKNYQPVEYTKGVHEE